MSARRTTKRASGGRNPRGTVFNRVFTQFSNSVARLTGKPVTFVLCCAVIIVWALSGPLFGYSDTWQLIINTGTTIVTFLMVFLIQNTQNRDGAAIQAKLDEIVRAIEGARNEFVGIEHLTDDELEEIRNACEEEVDTSKGDAANHRHRKRKLDATFKRLRRNR